MKYRHSEIFDNYAKLAIDTGLVSAEDIKKTAAEKTRYDSLSFSDIEALYGIKVGPEEKGQSIMEVAHPKEDMMVAAPAYDALNGVVEDNHLRQDIMTYIALKTPGGQLMGERYVRAVDELKDSLIKAAFYLDASNEDELMRMADDCAGIIHKQAALPALVLPIAAGVAAIAGLTYYFTQADVDVQNISANSDVLMNELEDVQGEPYAADISGKVSEIRSAASGYLEAMASLSKLGSQMVSAAKADQMDVVQQIHAQGEPLMQRIDDKSKKLMELSAELIELKSSVTNLSGQTESHSDWYNKLLSIKDFIVGSDPKDVLKAMDGLSKAIAQAMNRARMVVEQFKNKYSNAISKKIEVFEQKQEEVKTPDDYFQPGADAQTEQTEQVVEEPELELEV